ncbi:VOC family protein [Tepidiforma sp.]|uniref:VOC family protein n=1 Tax=Tepidiforma sp. TaxID=2682230 RepID=UPI002ADE1AC7|nr:VOC family protein [Tepidiforma sp.]
MLTRIDRIELVVHDGATAAQRFAALFGATTLSEDASSRLGARRTTLQAGSSLVELLEPAADGPVRAFADRWGQGLFGVGFATPSIDAMSARLRTLRVPFTVEYGLIYVDEAPYGLNAVIAQDVERPPVGDIRSIYEVTNPVSDWRAAADYYTRVFGLDPSRFCPIRSELYGYEGTLTLFDPPNRLDRIEITRTFGGGAMDRFFQKRGPSLYMCYLETDDVPLLEARLQDLGLRYAPGEGRPPGTNIFIHPSSLFGVLVGVSKTNFAWLWSGRPELSGAPPGTPMIH